MIFRQTEYDCELDFTHYPMDAHKPNCSLSLSPVPVPYQIVKVSQALLLLHRLCILLGQSLCIKFMNKWDKHRQTYRHPYVQEYKVMKC